MLYIDFYFNLSELTDKKFFVVAAKNVNVKKGKQIKFYLEIQS